VNQIEMVSIGQLLPYARNARTHDDAQVAQIAASIKEFGFNNPILIADDQSIVAGHGRLAAARKLGLTEVPVVRLSHLSDTQRKAYILADNRLALNAGWDNDLLKLELQELEIEGVDLEMLGFSKEELDGLLNSLEPTEGLTDEDAVPETPEEPITKPGDIWILGNHRLMCGDSTSIDAVDKLMNGDKADMVFTDPPYGIAHSGKGILGDAKENNFGEIMGDQNVTVAIDAFRLCAGQWPEARMIFWGANYYPSVLPDGHGWLVWDKQREGDTFSGAELAFINGGVRVDVFRHMWHGMIKASEQGKKRVHPTQKPIALAEWCFECYGDPGNVLDLFGGSGSTLIACEKTGRSCRMMELDPKYCDVIVKRWEEFTGKKAELADLRS
jgi:hypothetical protein